MTSSAPAISPYILNTRPQPMGAVLDDKLRQEKLASLSFPVIENQNLPAQEMLCQLPHNNLSELLADLDVRQNQKTTFWLFISRSSVLFFKQFLTTHKLKFSPMGTVIAVGDTTKSELQSISPDLQVLTPEQANSESLLAMDAFQPCRDIVMVKGVGGRGLMTKEFQLRNKQVLELDLYQRVPVMYPVNTMSKWQNVGIVLATSVDIASATLNNVHQLPKATIQQFLQTNRWIVLSERIKQFLMSNGVAANNIFVCEQSDNSSIIKLIKQINRH
ncbi:MAG: uroporphyrinogen-III synthase [Gammaproteobacteria bacterium]|nr:uroporphyrinogen-III synthase [Gammaproteobacteria bacterium]